MSERTNQESSNPMHLPLSRKEIADFLERSIYSVELAWWDGRLQKTLFAEDRLSHCLAQSTIFDVIEFRLNYGQNRHPISREHSAIWVSYLCELSELETWPQMSVEDRKSYVLRYAIDDGLCSSFDSQVTDIAFQIVEWQDCLLRMCISNDGVDELTRGRCKNFRLSDSFEQSLSWCGKLRSPVMGIEP